MIKSQIDIQKLSLRISKEAFLPSLSGAYSWSKHKDGMTGSAMENDQIKLNMNIELFNGFNRSNNIQKSKLSLDEAKLNYESVLRDYDELLSNQYKSLETQNKLITIHQTNLS